MGVFSRSLYCFDSLLCQKNDSFKLFSCPCTLSKLQFLFLYSDLFFTRLIPWLNPPLIKEGYNDSSTSTSELIETVASHPNNWFVSKANNWLRYHVRLFFLLFPWLSTLATFTAHLASPQLVLSYLDHTGTTRILNAVLVIGHSL